MTYGSTLRAILGGGDNSFDLSNAAYVTNFSVSSQATQPSDMFIGDSGTKMYVPDNANQRVYQYTLSSGWSMTGASYASKNFDFSSQLTFSSGIFFKSDGTKMYLLGGATSTGRNKIYQYTLSSAWDVSTASYDSVTITLSPGDDCGSMAFSTAGEELYVADNANNRVYQYDLSSAWDLSTASYASKSFYFFGQESVPEALAFKPDGSKMYVGGQTNDTIYQYTLSTPWDVSTASYDSVSVDVSTYSNPPTGVFFRDTGGRMFTISDNQDYAAQFSL